MLKKWWSALFKSKKQYLDTIEYLMRSRRVLMAQFNILMKTEWDMKEPTLVDMIRILHKYGASYSASKATVTLLTNPISVLYPIFIDMAECDHKVELSLVDQTLKVDGITIRHYTTTLPKDILLSTFANLRKKES